MEHTQVYNFKKQTMSIPYRQGVIPLFANIYRFRQEVTVTDFITGTILDTKTQYTYTGKGVRGTSSATVPRGFGLIDDWIDFCVLIDSGRYKESIGLYYRLKRFLNY